MFNYMDLAIAFLISLISTFLLTYPVKKIAIKFKVVDFPNYRKIHKKVTPRLGGLAIFLGAFLGVLYLQPHHEHLPSILMGGLTIIATGVLDDGITIRPVIKLSVQLIAASSLISSGFIMKRRTLQFIGMVDSVFSVS